MRADDADPLALVARTARFVSAAALAWEGEEISVPGSPTSEDPTPPVVAAMGHFLYAGLYVRPVTHLRMRGSYVPSRGPTLSHGPPDPLLDREWAAAIDRANTTPAWDGGWRMNGDAGETRVQIEKDGAVRVVARSGVRDAGDGRIDVAVDRGAANNQPGWIYFNGLRSHEDIDRVDTVRLYWNVSKAGGPTLVRALSAAMNAAGVAFRGKILSKPAAFNRADACVVYLPESEWDAAVPAIRKTHAQVAAYLRGTTPLLTRRLARGLGLAQDPGLKAQSFGTLRCRQLAEGLWEAHEAEARALEDVRAVLARSLSEKRLDLQRLHLRAGATHDPAEAYERGGYPHARAVAP